MGKKVVVQEYLISMLGGILFAATMNRLILPYGLYSGTLAGVAQMVEVLAKDLLGLPIPDDYNLMGVILLCFNLPLFLLGYRLISRRFLLKTIATVVVQSMAMSLIPIPANPPLDNVLTASILGGLIAGYGAGITLRAGGSGGGTDIIGLLCTKRWPGFSVGRLALLISAVVFTYSLIRYDLNIVVYSAIFTVFYAVTIDRTHYQNIKIQVMILTRKLDVARFVTDNLHRGATYWRGTSPYTGEDTYVCMSVLSKYEAGSLRRSIHTLDPAAFIILNERTDVSGNFEQRV